MKQFILHTLKNSLYGLFGHFKFQQLLLRSKYPLFLPFYHTISERFLPHIDYLYKTRNTNLFKQDLDFFITHFQAVTIDQLEAFSINYSSSSSPSFHLTFDDGLKEIYTVVAPLLIEKGIPATFFVNSAFVDNKDLFYRYKVSLLLHRLKQKTLSSNTEKEALSILHKAGILSSNLSKGLLSIDYTNKFILEPLAILLEVDFKEYLNTQRPYMSTEEIMDLKNKGFSIGAHSIDHPLYAQINLDEQIRQTQTSLDFVKQKFGMQKALFSFPFSDEKISSQFFDRIFDPVHPIADLTFGISGLKIDESPRHLHRFPMEGSLASAEKLVRSEYLYYLAKAPFLKNKIHRKE